MEETSADLVLPTSPSFQLLQRVSDTAATASLDEMVAATGWLAHTPRTELTGLKKKGRRIGKSKRNDVICYRIVAGSRRRTQRQDHLVKLIIQERAWWQEMCADEVSALNLATRHGVNDSYVSGVIRINFLAPPIIEAVLAGEQPATLNARRMLGLTDLPLSWAAQAHHLQFR